MENKLTIIIADDHPLIREGLVHLITQQNIFTNIIEVTSGYEVISESEKSIPDIILLDIEIPGINGIDVSKILLKKYPSLKIIFLTMYNDEEILTEAIENGILGYVLKENSSEEIINCIKTVLKGNKYFSAQLSEKLVKKLESKHKRDEISLMLDKLSISEKRIIKLISENNTSKEIAEILFITPKTVENHRKNICDKLGLSGSHKLLKYALENKNKIL